MSERYIAKTSFILYFPEIVSNHCYRCHEQCTLWVAVMLSIDAMLYWHLQIKCSSLWVMMLSGLVQTKNWMSTLICQNADAIRQLKIQLSNIGCTRLRFKLVCFVNKSVLVLQTGYICKSIS